jgi:hypothetical protein
MITVTFGMNISKDGYCDHTIGNPSGELMDYFTRTMGDIDRFFTVVSCMSSCFPVGQILQKYVRCFIAELIEIN